MLKSLCNLAIQINQILKLNKYKKMEMTHNLENLSPATQKHQLENFNIYKVMEVGKLATIRSEAHMSFEWACQIVKELCSDNVTTVN